MYVLRDGSAQVFQGKTGIYHSFIQELKYFFLEELVSWAQSERFPLVARLTGANLAQIASTGKFIVISVINQVRIENIGFSHITSQIDKKNQGSESGKLFGVVEEAAQEARKDEELKK